MIAPLLLALAAAGDSLPTVTLAEAVRRAARVDPQVVRARVDVESAEWARRQAVLAFVLPSVTTSIDATKFSQPFFNIGVGRPTSTAVNFRLNAQYELLSLRKLTDLTQSAAGLEAAAETDAQQRLQAAFLAESDYYQVLLARELVRVGEERLARAREQLGVGRARVLSGAVTQTDSLQLSVEVARAETDILRQRVALSVARRQLGRRVGEEGPVDAAPLDGAPPPPLDFSLDEAVRSALVEAPPYRAARAAERRAVADLRGERGAYLPTFNLTAGYTRFDEQFFPSGREVAQVQLQVSLPLWNNAQRELQVQQARAARDVAAAVRADLERAAHPDVAQAYEGYGAAREAERLAEAVLAAARETFRVQDLRYRSGATTILDLLDAQFTLTQADADLTTARYATRLALAGLEQVLGRRLRRDQDLP